MAEEQIASGRIDIDLNDKSVLAGLREIEAQFDRTMKDIDRQHASAAIDANIAPLEDAVVKAKRRVRELEGQKATVTVKAEKKQLDAAIKEARAEVKKLDGEKATVEIEYKSDTAALKATQARMKAIDTAARAREAFDRKADALRAKRQRQQEQDAAQNLRNVTKLAKTVRTFEDQRLRELANAEREARKVNDQLEREAASIPKLKRQYAELAVQIDRLNTARRKVKHDEKASLVVDLKTAEAVAEMASLKAKLIALGKSPPDVEIAIKPGHKTGESIRRAISDGFHEGGVRKAVHDAGMLSGIMFSDALGEGIRRNLKPRTLLGSLGGGLSAIGGKILGGLGKLSDATVRIGPFTATIKQAVLAVSLLAPVILDVVGALGSLVAVTGSGIVGAMGAGTAAVGAFGLVLGASALLLPPLLKDYRNLNTMQNAYNTAVLKYGKNSDQAKDKLKQFNHAMKGVSPTAREAFLSIDKMQTSWRALSRESRPAFLNALGQGIETARASIKRFGPEVTQSFGLVAHGVEVAAKSLRSFEAQRIIQSLFDDGQKALPEFGRGLANLAHAAGLVAVAFGHMLPSLGHGFEDWTKGVLKATQNTSKLTNIVNQSTESMRDIGHLAASGGKFLAAFFGGGVESGQKFTMTMSQALDRWTAFLHTTQGQNSLHKFFSEAVSGVQSLWATLAPLIDSFVTWAASIAPFARMFLQGAAAISQMVAAFLKLTGLQSPIAALITTLGVLWGIGKISAATQAVTGFTRALFGMAGAQRAVAVSGAESALVGGVGAAGAAGVARGAGAAEGAVAGAAAARAAGGVTKLAKAGNLAKGALGALGLATIGVGTVTAGLGVVALAAAAGLYAYETRTRDWEKAAKAADKASQGLALGLSALDNNSTVLAQSTITLSSAHKSVRDAMKQSNTEQKELNKLQAEGKTGTAAYRDLEEQHKNTILQVKQARLDETNAIRNKIKASQDDLKNEKLSLKAAKDNLKARQDSQKSLGDNKHGSFLGMGGTTTKKQYDEIAHAAAQAGMTVKGFLGTQLGANFALTHGGEQALQYAKKMAQTAAAARILRDAEDRVTLAALNHTRALRGLAPIAQAAARVLGDVTRKMGSGALAKTISLKFKDSGDAARVASSASRALSMGVPKQVVTKIIADSKNAEDAIRRVSAASRALAAQKVAVAIGASDSASQKIASIIKRVNSIPNKTARIAARDAAIPVIARIIGRIAGIKDKTARIIARDLASGPARTVAQLLASLHDKTVTLTTNIRTNHFGTGTNASNSAPPKSGPRAASGRMPGAAATTLIGEGRADEYHVDTVSGRAYKTNGPMFAKVNARDAIIPTEPAYKSRGREIFKSIARDLGLQMAAKGKPPKHTNTPNNSKAALTDYGKKIQRKTARKIASKMTTGHGKSKTWIDKVNAAKQAEDDQNFEIGRAEGKLDEPSSFIKVTGQDAQGNDLYALDTSAIQSWSLQLDRVRQMYDDLLAKIQATAKAIADADKNISQIISRATKNSPVLADQMKREKSLQTKKGASPSEKAAATQRYNTYKTLYTAERQDLDDAKTDKATLPMERHDLKQRQETAGDARDKYKSDADGIMSLATAQLADAQPKPNKPDSGGSGADGTSTPSVIEQLATLSTEREDLYKSFGGNTASPSSQAYASSQGSVNGPGGLTTASADSGTSSTGIPFSTRGAFAAMGSSGQASAAVAGMGSYGAPNSAPVNNAGTVASGGASVTINQTFHEMPDPHSWSKGVEFELQAAL